MTLESEWDYSVPEFNRGVRFNKRTKEKQGSGGINSSKRSVVDPLEDRLTSEETAREIKGRIRLQNSRLRLGLVVVKGPAWKSYEKKHAEEISSMPMYLALQVVDIESVRAQVEGMKNKLG